MLNRVREHILNCILKTTNPHELSSIVLTWIDFEKTVQDCNLQEFKEPETLDPKKGRYTIRLSYISGSGWINTIKIIREAAGLGLKEAKDIADSIRDRGAIQDLPVFLDFRTAEMLQKKFLECGTSAIIVSC